MAINVDGCVELVGSEMKATGDLAGMAPFAVALFFAQARRRERPCANTQIDLLIIHNRIVSDSTT